MLESGALQVLAGSSIGRFADGPNDKARFNHPGGLAIDTDGNLYVGDVDDRRVRMVVMR